MAGLMYSDQEAYGASMKATQRTVSSDGATWQSLVTFRLERQTYALPNDCVVQIVEMVTITRIPQLDSVVEGVINVHGESVAAFKLRRLFGLPDTPVKLDTPMLLVRIEGRMVGLIVDEVVDVFSLSDHKVVRLPDIVPTSLGEAPIFCGLIHIAGSAVLMLDPEKLLQPQQLHALTQVTEILQQAAADEGQPTEGESEAVVEEVPEEPPSEPKAKTTRRRRKKTPSKKAPSKETPKSKPARRRRKKRATEEKTVATPDEESEA